MCKNCEELYDAFDSAKQEIKGLRNEISRLEDEIRSLESDKYELQRRIDEAGRELRYVQDGYELEKAKRVLRG